MSDGGREPVERYIFGEVFGGRFGRKAMRKRQSGGMIRCQIQILALL
jgi:hypothetical protein